MNTQQVLNSIKEENVKEIALQFTDLSGILHSLWIPSEEFSKVLKDGIHTDGSSLSGIVDVSKSDVKLLPDIDSFVILPPVLFQYRIARVICDIYKPDSNVPFELDPRFILKQTLANLKSELGESVIGVASSEIEFFLFHKTDDGELKLIDDAGYLASPPHDRGASLRLDITESLRKIGIMIEKHHHEVPAGKSEFNIPHLEALQMVDTIYLIKFIIKIMASKAGLIASFMPKPFHGEYGAGLHTHLNLKDEKTEENLFIGKDNNTKLSKLAQHFLGGILEHAKALACITNPSVNSYKRLVPGWEAPVYISWANYNRSTLVRIPPGGKKSTRIEYRPTDGSCNFYLAYAGLFSAGLDGIKRQIIPPGAVEENIYNMNDQERANRGIKVLPENLGESIKALSKDSVFTDTLGESFVKKYLDIKLKEWKEFSVYVHKWERLRYLDV